MLIAITRRKAGRKLVDREDILTSAVFGQLKYVPPHVFWLSILTSSRSCADDSSLADFTARTGIDFDKYEFVETKIWPRRERVQPDVIVTFTGRNQPTFELIIEVKLRAFRGVRGKKDQLARYMRLTRPCTKKSVGAFIYLTPNESRYADDLEDAFECDRRLEKYRRRAFHLHWSAVVKAIEDESQSGLEHPYGMMLKDLSEYLQVILAAKPAPIAKPIAPEAPVLNSDERSSGFVINVFAW